MRLRGAVGAQQLCQPDAGPQGYLHACIWLAQLLRTDGSSKAHIVM